MSKLPGFGLEGGINFRLYSPVPIYVNGTKCYQILFSLWDVCSIICFYWVCNGVSCEEFQC